MPESACASLPDCHVADKDDGDGPLLKVGERGLPRSALRRDEGWRRHFHATGVIDISVCIANWNCRDLLRQCLQSLHDRDQGVIVETIVVDNASTDGAADMVAREFPEVVLIRNERNEGFARANNQAACRARGRYLFFLNNDTVVPAQTLRRMLEYFDAHPHVGMLGPRLRGIDGEVQVSYRPRPTLAAFLHRARLFRWLGLWRSAYRRFRRDNFDADSPRQVDILMGAAVMAPRARFLIWGGWDEDFAFGGEDMELSCRIGRHAPLVFLPSTEILHYGSISTRCSPTASTKIAIGFVQYFRKAGCSRLSLWLYKVAVILDAPLEGVVKFVQYSYRSMRGQKRKAEKSLVAARAAWRFLLRGLIPFWRA
jgi:GT2 family glycosyltransferase